MMVFLILAPYGAFAALMMVIDRHQPVRLAAICLAVVAFDIWRGRSKPAPVGRDLQRHRPLRHWSIPR
jgi:hypothetical protein